MAFRSHTPRLPKPRLRLKSGKALIDAGVIVLLVGVIGFAIYQVARHMTADLNTLRTQEIVDESYVRMNLYLFRDEEVLTAEGSDTCLYRVTNGQKVRADSTLGTAYAVGEGAQEIQAELNALRVRMTLLEASRGAGTPSDVRNTALAADRHYIAMLEATARGHLDAAWDLAGHMLTELEMYDILTGAASGQNTDAATLQAQGEALVAGYPVVSDLHTERGGYFYYDADGYESVFDYDTALTMTAAEFRAMTTQPAAEVPSSVVGKMVYSPLWYAAAYVSLDDAAAFRVGRTYTMRCNDGTQTEIPMAVERMEPDANGALLVFSSRSMPTGFRFERTLQVETVASRASGYRIPTEALVTLPSPADGSAVTGVYILSGNVVEFRKIDITVRREGYIIAKTYEDVKAMLDGLDEDAYDRLTADGWPYLRFNDKIITGSELYEGKRIG